MHNDQNQGMTLLLHMEALRRALTYALIRAGIVNYESVCSKRPYVVVAILVLAALLTPPDVVTQIFLGFPTYILFETGLLAARRYKGMA